MARVFFRSLGKRQWRDCIFFNATLTLAFLLLGTSTFAQGFSYEAHKGRIQVISENGTPLPLHAIIGHEITIGTVGAGGYRARITGLIEDPFAGPEPLILYQVKYRDPNTGIWNEICEAGPHGLALAVAVSGTWSATGIFQTSTDGSFVFNCTSGAHVKCLRLGYAPWASDESGRSLSDHHQACTRMMRADYCGTGQTFTITGSKVQVYDRLSARPKNLIGTLEAVWGTDGAICIRKPRVSQEFSLDAILAACPRLEETQAQCDADLLDTNPSALLVNHSK